MAETDPYKKKRRKPAKKGIVEIIQDQVMKFVKKSSEDTHKKILGEKKKTLHKKKKNTDPYADKSKKSSKRK